MQFPSVDLASDDWTPDQYRLTLLEMQVFLGAFLQAFPSGEGESLAHVSQQKQTVELGLLDRLMGTQIASASEAPQASKSPKATPPPPPCTEFKKWLNDWGKSAHLETPISSSNDLMTVLVAELTGVGMNQLTGVIDKGITAIMEKITGVAQEVSQIASKVLQTINLLVKLQKLAMLYHSIEIKVAANPWSSHMPGPHDENVDIKFTAKVGVNEEMYKEYLSEWNASDTAKSVKECLSFAGLPAWTDSSDIAADVENWSVEWDIVEGGNSLVTWGLGANDFELDGQQQMKVKRTGPTSGEAVFTTNVVREEERGHQGPELEGFVVIRASADTAGMPPILAQLVNGGKIAKDGFKGVAESALWGLLGIVDTLADVVTGWYQSIVKPESYGNALVTYHEDEFPLLLGSANHTYQSSSKVDKANIELSRTVNIELLDRIRIEKDANGNRYGVYKARVDYLQTEKGTGPADVSFCPGVFRDISLSKNEQMEAKVSFGNGQIIIETDVFNLPRSGYECVNPELDDYTGKVSIYIPYEGEKESITGIKTTGPKVEGSGSNTSTVSTSTDWDFTLE
ncbi:hypothetical protein ACX1C1_13450 [Paenibacillus sp. strain BS8-2]